MSLVRIVGTMTIDDVLGTYMLLGKLDLAVVFASVQPFRQVL